MPQLGDPNFHRSVVLMIEHGDAGSMGLVINRAAPLSLGELARGQSEKHEVVPGLYLSFTVDALQPLLQNASSKLRFCLGYAGWGPKQLENEIAAGAWLCTEASAVPTLESEPDHLWDEILRGMGLDPAMILPAKGIQ